MAAKNGHKEVVKILLEHGADINSRTNSGKYIIRIMSLFYWIKCLLSISFNYNARTNIV